MNQSPAVDLAKYIAARGVGTWAADSGWSINVASEPASPETAITFYDTSGGEPDTDELDVFRPSFQVRVRSSNYQDAYAKQVAIRDLLIYDPIETDDYLFSLIVMTSDILPLGRDANNRHLLVANYRSRRSMKEN